MLRCVWIALLVASCVVNADEFLEHFATTPPPARPDFSKLSEAEAEAADAAYRRAYDEWLKQETPARERAIEQAIANAEARKRARELAEVEAEKRKAAGAVAPPELPISNIGIRADYGWELDATAQGLSESAIDGLRRDGLVIAGPSYRQSFSIYGERGVIPFVTSDSLLNGFHVLLESSLKRFETRRATRLRHLLADTWATLPRRLAQTKLSPEQVQPYARHLALVIGPALRLLGDETKFGDAALENEIARSVKLIRAADEMVLPVWLAPETPQFLAIDFQRCKPTGFYSDTETLSDYYRAVRWLQMVPFRSERPVEAGAAALFTDLNGEVESLEKFVESGAAIWGAEDGPTFAKLRRSWPRFLEVFATKSEAGAISKAVAVLQSSEKYDQPLIRDTLRSTEKGAAATTFLAGAALPDSVFLVRLREKSDAKAGSLEVGAWLGSDFAAREMKSRGAPDVWIEMVTPEHDWPRHVSRRSGLPEVYYWTLAALFAPVDRAAPPFMHSEAWERKSLQTALSGWAQLRHAWELQGKLAIYTLGATTRPAGIVEPNSLFWQRMAELAGATIVRFQGAGVFSPSPEDEVEFLVGGLRLLERLGAGKVELSGDFSGEESDLIADLAFAAQRDGAKVEPLAHHDLRGEAQKESFRELLRAIRARVDRLQRGERVTPLGGISLRRDPDQQLFDRWQELQSIASRLAMMAEKQLRQADWNEDEAQFLQSYQESLGTVMGYFGSAASSPKDDAPRIASVSHDPQAGETLHAAIGRPRALYVLYPWKDTLVLARGAVMPFYEHNASSRFDDEAWRRELDRKPSPVQPDWIRSIVIPEPAGAPR